jgi:hypothetical protein
MKVRTKFDIYVFIDETETTMQLNANHTKVAMGKMSKDILGDYPTSKYIS